MISATMNQMLPLVSVILPVFNRRYVIERALNSVIAQTFQDFELLIVDDGSTDGLEERVIPEILHRPNWRYLKHANRRLAWTRNIGLFAALAKLVTFLDSDDEYLPEHLALRVDFMTQHPEVDIIHGGYELIGPEEYHWVRDVRHPARKIHLNDCCLGATLFGKKDVFLQAGGFPLVNFSSEYYLLQQLEKRFCVKRVFFSTYRYHTESEDRLCRRQENQA